MGTELQQYTFQWSNYENQLPAIVFQLLHEGCQADVALCAEGQRVYAHRIVLSACSPFFQEILSNAEETYPYIILSEMNCNDLQTIVEYIYCGELSVSEDRLWSVLKAAEDLKIKGLAGVLEHLPLLEPKSSNEQNYQKELQAWVENLELDTLTTEYAPEEINMESYVEDGFILDADEQISAVQTIEISSGQASGQQPNKKKAEEKKKRQRRETSKKDYSEDALMAALEELQSGRSLMDVATAYHIPRSTLYVRARTKGVSLTIPRQEHTAENIQAALQAISGYPAPSASRLSEAGEKLELEDTSSSGGGASLHQAARQYKIPKTVLWRRVQKEMTNYRGRAKPSYCLEAKEAAIKALERGENLTRVAQEYQIPKTTLFREKSRLVESGKLPWSCLKRKDPDTEGFREHRLLEAVAACKEGKMSQAAASLTYQVPKTTIWRRLQQGSQKQSKAAEKSEKMPLLQEQPEQLPIFNEVSQDIPATYVTESEFAETSLIILTSCENNNVIAISDNTMNSVDKKECVEETE